MTTVVYLCDRDLRPVTDPIPWTEVDATVRHLEPGSASVTCAATPEVMEQLDAARMTGRIGVILHDGLVFLAGPVELPHKDYVWTAGTGQGVEPGEVVFHIGDYLALVAGRVTYPDPASPWTDQSAIESYVDSGPASTVLLDLVNVNAGPGALAARRVPHLVMGADPVAGPDVIVSSRFKWLLEEARSVVTRAGGAIGYRTAFDQASRTVTFEVFETVDRSASVRFSSALGNLRAVQFSSQIPKATTELVAGQGQGTSRVTLERTDSTAEANLWRIEEFLDARNDGTTELLEAAGDERLAEQGGTVRLGTVTVDTPDQRYGVHYGLGDLVTVEPRPGRSYVDAVLSVHLLVTPRTGAVVTPQVGSQAARAAEPQQLRKTQDLDRRVRRLEAEGTVLGTFGMTGEIRMWSGDTAPSGWAFCRGQALSRTGDSALFTVIGTKYGAGDGSTTFNVPNLQGRVPVGLDSGQSEFNALGKTGGAKTHTLTQNEMPSHTHTQNSHNHTQNSHSHPMTEGSTGLVSYAGGDTPQYAVAGGSTFTFASGGVPGNATATNQSTTATNQNAGGGAAHNNLQPFVTINYIIKL